ncbi:YagK/YfjJ domain-containing protein [Acinetobacter sp. NIPH 2100]|uniref:YagK/YfjJ domain-containing protein n=1 Tax=Acinetobacter sp. NIPH 2100 TaxID=1217708 RepID=UPI0002CEC986|nr:inovirus-type Gp2 protein [Acinetobacter sp. NIPH 2100]ENX38313.1 hypothetical protein F887_03481 [Acinetobacter sp. NIPH 2100]
MNTQTTTVNESEILIGIEQFIQRVLYTPRMSDQEFTQRLLELVPLFEMIEDRDLNYCRSIEIFRFVIEKLKLMGNVSIPYYLRSYDTEQINALKSCICESSREIDDEVKAFQQQEKRNKKSLYQYLTKLTQHYAKLLFVRVDLGIQFKHQFDVGIEEFNFYMRRLLKRVHDQDTCFQGLQGYAWAIEQGEKKGYHCHLLLIYDGHKHQNDFGLASMVGECWNEITEDQGYFFTSNTPEYKSRLEQKEVLGIGMIHRDNPQQVLNAINAAMYLVNPEKDGQHLRAWVDSMRTFGRGQYDLGWRRDRDSSIIPTSLVNQSQVLIAIDRFIHSVIHAQVDDQQFKQRLMELVPLFQSIGEPDLKYSLSIEAFKNIILLLKKSCTDFSPCMIELFDTQQIKEIRDYITDRTELLKVDLKWLVDKNVININRLAKFLRGLTRNYTKLLFVRVDLAIQLEHQSKVGIKQFNAYLRILLKQIHDQNCGFKGMLGYSWSVEQDEDMGYHCHLLLIYDGEKHQNDFGLALQAGQRWIEITNGQGVFLNLNAPEYKSQFEQDGKLGIGMIHRDDLQSAPNIINAATYLVTSDKEGQYLRVWEDSMPNYGEGHMNMIGV